MKTINWGDSINTSAIAPPGHDGYVASEPFCGPDCQICNPNFYKAAHQKLSNQEPAKPEQKPAEPAPIVRADAWFEYDADGWAKPVQLADNPEGLRRTELRRRIGDIARAVGHGRIVARGRHTMTRTQCLAWLHAWHCGNLRRCYQLEATVGAPSAKHPGAPTNPDTHKVIWRPAVAGEIPAGATVDGAWPSPEEKWPTSQISNYLMAAKMANPRHLGPSARQRWVKAHILADKYTVDTASQTARVRAETGQWALTSALVWNPGLAELPTPDSAALIDNGVDPSRWPLHRLRQYLAEHQLPVLDFWDEQVTAVSVHLVQVAEEKAAIAARLELRYAPDQPVLSGTHKKAVLLDQHGRCWLYKPVSDAAHRFRAETEHEAHVLARLWGYPVAESRLVDFDGSFGQVQAMLPATGSLATFRDADFAALTVAQLAAVANEHLLDWALDNDDTHGDNILICADGGVVGIDKGRAWRYFGGWDGLSANASANSNAQLVYTHLYDAIRDHHLDREVVDVVYRAVIAQARRMQRLPDSTLAEVIGRAVANRPHFHPPRYQHRIIDDAPTTPAELIAAATVRKNSLVADMQQLWQRVYDGAGWELPNAAQSSLGDNPQGHPMFAGLHCPALHAAVAQSKSYGTPTFVAGREVEDAHLLLWREKQPSGVFAIRGQAKLRAPAFSQLRDWCRTRATKAGVKESAKVPTLPVEFGAYAALIYGAKTVSYHHEDQEFNQEKLDLMAAAKTKLILARQLAQDQLDKDAPDPYGIYAATVAMATTYLGYITRIEQHKADRTRSNDGDFPRFTWTPKKAAPAPAPTAPTATVELRSASRAAASMGRDPVFDEDGELQVTTDLLINADWGQAGLMYLITLPTGEQIEYRGGANDTGTMLSTRGLLQFTIPDAATIAESLHRIDTQLTEMGLTLTPAAPVDLELFYWRHLAAIMNDRADSCRGNTGWAQYQKFWKSVPADETVAAMDPTAEQDMWRAAFAEFTSSDTVTQFLAAGGHLPRFMHLDLRQPEMPCGKPYWERLDVPDTAWLGKQMPTLHYRTGPANVLRAGAAMSTEARIRTLAIWKCGQSSYEDMRVGSAAFLFCRLNQESGLYSFPNVYLNPRVLRRTHNYSYNNDKYGSIEYRRTLANFHFGSMTGHKDSGNELLIKDTVSLLDDIEFVVFETVLDRDKAVAALVKLGITTIRGLPVGKRVIVRGDWAIGAAVMACRAAYTGSQPEGGQSWNPSSSTSVTATAQWVSGELIVTPVTSSATTSTTADLLPV